MNDHPKSRKGDDIGNIVPCFDHTIDADGCVALLCGIDDEVIELFRVEALGVSFDGERSKVLTHKRPLSETAFR